MIARIGGASGSKNAFNRIFTAVVFEQKILRDVRVGQHHPPCVNNSTGAGNRFQKSSVFCCAENIYHYRTSFFGVLTAFSAVVCGIGFIFGAFTAEFSAGEEVARILELFSVSAAFSVSSFLPTTPFCFLISYLISVVVEIFAFSILLLSGRFP